jgi:hypothetical protein
MPAFLHISSLFTYWNFTHAFLLTELEFRHTTDPSKQFALVAQHVGMLRQIPGKSASPVMIYVERNLGFEAEHHKRALDHLPGA